MFNDFFIFYLCILIIIVFKKFFKVKIINNSVCCKYFGCLWFILFFYDVKWRCVWLKIENKYLKKMKLFIMVN